MPWKPFSSKGALAYHIGRKQSASIGGPRNRSVVGKLVRDRFGSKAALTTLKCDFRSYPNSGHHVSEQALPKSATICREQTTRSATQSPRRRWRAVSVVQRGQVPWRYLVGACTGR